MARRTSAPRRRRSSLVLTAVAAGLCTAASAIDNDSPPAAAEHQINQLRGQQRHQIDARDRRSSSRIDTMTEEPPSTAQLIDETDSFRDPFFGLDLDALGDIPVPIDGDHFPEISDNHRYLSEDGETYLHNIFLGDQPLDLTPYEESNDQGEEEPYDGSNRIVNGVRTRVPPFVMTIDIRNGEPYRGVCGCTMVSKTWGVTAAHCISNYSPNDLKNKFEAGYVGAYAPWKNVGGKNEGRNYQILYVKRFVCHPDHVPGAGSKHDICLVEFEGEVDTSKFTDFNPMPICNYEMQDSDSGTMGEVIGMGSMRYQGRKSTELLKADVGYVKRSTCRAKFNSVNMDVSDDMLCFGGQGKDSCG